MYLCGAGFDLQDLPVEAINVLVKIEKITKAKR